jgi:phosphoglycolate phosphatase-like HAD superfamily hydrolase
MTAIFFDLDSAISDLKEGIPKSISYALRELEAEVPSYDDLITKPLEFLDVVV